MGQSEGLPFSPKEAKWIAAALVAYPAAFLVFLAGILASAWGDEPSVSPLSFIGFGLMAVPSLVLFYAIIRLAGRGRGSVGGTLFEFFLRAPLSLVFGDYGRRTFALAEWPRGLLWLERALWAAAGLLDAAAVIGLAFRAD